MSAESLARGIATELANEGFPRVPAQILLRLMAEPSGRMTAAALGESLGLSAAAVSGGIRYLGVLGFVRVETVPGTRRHLYSLPVLPWYASTLMQDRYGPLRTLIAAEIGQVEEGPARERLLEMDDFFRFLQGEMPTLWERWRASRGGSEPV